MKTIKKQFQSLKQAERYQNSLYNAYDVVRLVKSPLFGESGVYVWNVG